MKILRSSIPALILLAFGAHAGSLSEITERLPEIGAPPQGHAHWVARSMRVNGLPMTLKTFSSRLSADAVLHHYESTARNGAGVESRRSTQGEWRVLTVRSPQHLITIQVRAIREGSHGTITVSPDLSRAKLKVETRFPMPASARVVNLQQYEDFGIESEHISASSVRSVTIEAHAFSQILTRHGWRLVQQRATQEVQRGEIIEAQKGAQHALLTLMRDQSSASSTAIVIVWKKA